MTNNKLGLNANTTDFIIIDTSRQRSKLTHFFPTNILSHSITPSDIVRNLGDTFDSDFNFRKHVSMTCRSCFYHIRDLRRIWRYIFLSVAKTIGTALITSRIDYCNSLFYNINFFITLHPYHPSAENSVHLVFACYLFPGLQLMLRVVLFQFLTLWNSLSEHIKSSNSIVSFRLFFLCIVSGLWVCPTPVLGGPLS